MVWTPRQIFVVATTAEGRLFIVDVCSGDGIASIIASCVRLAVDVQFSCFSSDPVGSFPGDSKECRSL
jgi:hypothetical protein